MRGRVVKRVLLAVGLIGLASWTGWQAACVGWASFQSMEARATLARALQKGTAPAAREWAAARDGFLAALQWDAENPEYHQGYADLYMVRLARVAGDPKNMAPYFDIALRHYAKAALLRPTWPFSHNGIVAAKSQQGHFDAQFKQALVLAARYGPWESGVQQVLITAGYRAWPSLDEAEREVIRGNLRRAHQWRPQPTAAQLTSLARNLPPCHELQVDVPGACRASGQEATPPEKPTTRSRKPAR